MDKVLAIVGPTAVGKTDLSLEIAEKYNGEIISGDSMQVYRGLDIGTAKVSVEEQARVKHHLIDVRDVTERFSASDFKQEASTLIKKITEQGKLPIIVGGTGFYLQALLENLQLGSENESRDDIEQIRLKLNTQTTDELLKYLQTIDPITFSKIDQNNRRRIIRAIEVYEATGVTFSAQKANAQAYDSLIVGLNTDRAQLYERINQRVDLMIDKDLESEVRHLFDSGDDLQSQNGIGYREWKAYFNGELALDEVIDNIKRDSRHYAKRQLTWFRNKMDVKWFDIIEHSEDKALINKEIEGWLKDEVDR